MKEKKDRLDDALNATKAAVEEGIIPGGGTALLKIAKDLKGKIKLKNKEQQHGAEIVLSACLAPFQTILSNAGLDSENVLSELPTTKKDINVGYDARNEEVVDMFKAGIIDPTKVTRTALQKAASVAGLILTTECVITNDPNSKPGMSKGMPPMM